MCLEEKEGRSISCEKDERKNKKKISKRGMGKKGENVFMINEEREGELHELFITLSTPLRELRPVTFSLL